MRNQLLGFSPIFPSPLDAKELGWGLLLGKDDGFSSEMKAQTRAAGVTHLTAASGANISLFQGLLWPVQSMFWLHVGLEGAVIALYWVLSGASGSLWRASILAVLSLGARVVGRPVSFPWLLCLVVALALWTGWSDSLGFWLSWLAVSGVIVSQFILPGEKKHALSPHLWGFCKWVGSTVLSGSLIMILVSVVLFRVFGEWQPQGLIGTIVSTPFVPLYLATFVSWFLFQEGNKVALQFASGPGFLLQIAATLSSGLLQVLLGWLFTLWTLVAWTPDLISVGLIAVSLSYGASLLVQRARSLLRQRRAARQWGWQL